MWSCPNPLCRSSGDLLSFSLKKGSEGVPKCKFRCVECLEQSVDYVHPPSWLDVLDTSIGLYKYPLLLAPGNEDEQELHPEEYLIGRVQKEVWGKEKMEVLLKSQEQHT